MGRMSIITFQINFASVTRYQTKMEELQKVKNYFRGWKFFGESFLAGACI